MSEQYKRDLRRRLMAALENFKLEEALKLSDELHEFEASGGYVPPSEDRLWLQLTIKIETARRIAESDDQSRQWDDE